MVKFHIHDIFLDDVPMVNVKLSISQKLCMEYSSSYMQEAELQITFEDCPRKISHLLKARKILSQSEYVGNRWSIPL